MGRPEYLRYIRSTKVLLKNNELLPLLKMLSTKVDSENNLKISNVDSSVLHSAEREAKHFMSEPADYFVRNPTKIAVFYAVVF